MATTITKEQEVVKTKSTLVRRVSDLFKADGNNGGPPSLFRQGSIQALRHCCQNLNLFPYLLYSFARNTKEHPMPMKVNMCLAFLVTRITERIFRVYSSLRQAIICGLRLESMCSSSSVATATNKTVKSSTNVKYVEQQQRQPETTIVAPPAPKFEKFERQKPRQNPWFLKLAVYFAPLVLAFQLIGVFSLIVFGKYTPGFVFLVSALLFLGYISMRVLVHDTTSSVHTLKREKRKIE